MRKYIVSLLLIGTSLALLYFFGCIWLFGSHYIQEPNKLVLIAETAGMMVILTFALHNLVKIGKGG